MYKLSQIAPLLKGKLTGNDSTFIAVSTDSRAINPGDLFVALVGEKFDGHRFIEEAKKRGAVGALISQPVDTDLPCIQVNDTLTALGELAAWHRQHFNLPVIALTGSCGKTTTKTLLGKILELVAPTLTSLGNLNNAIGLPLSLLRLNAEHKFAVLEMGADHAGEIAYLCKIAKPTETMITCVRPVHVKGFGSVDEIAQAKSEIYQGLAANGVAALNVDEPYFAQWKKLLPTQKIVTFGLQGGQVTAKNIHLDAQGHPIFTLCIDKQEVIVNLPLLGEFNVLNALAAAACAWMLQVPLAVIKQGLENAEPVKGRLVPKTGYKGALLLDDHYNSNPAALQEALKILATYPGKKLLAIGDMLELGNMEKSQHELAATWAKAAGVTGVFAFGNCTRFTVNAFGKGAQHFDTHAALAEALRAELDEHATVLIKGSRSMRMEEVVSKLLA